MNASLVSHSVPEHGWSSVKTPDDAIGFDRFYNSMKKRNELIYPSVGEIVTYLRMVEKGEAPHSERFTQEDIDDFRENNKLDFSMLKYAKWFCPKNTLTVDVPKYPFTIGNELDTGVGIANRLRPADLLAIHTDLRKMEIASGYKNATAFLLSSSLFLTDWQIKDILESGDGNAAHKPLICKACGEAHQGASAVARLRSFNLMNEKIKLNVGLISMLKSKESYSRAFEMLDRNQVPFSSLQGVMDFSSTTEDGYFFFNEAVEGVTNRTIEVFKSLKRYKLPIADAAQWAIACSAFSFVWDERTRVEIWEFISSGKKPSVLNEVWMKTYNPLEDSAAELLLSVRLYENNVDRDLINSLMESA